VREKRDTKCMRIWKPLATIAAIAGTLFAAAPAPAVASGWAAGEQPELELTARLSERLDIRFGVSTTDPQPLLTDDADQALNRGTPSAVSTRVDWSFNDTGMRMTGGMLYGANFLSEGLDPLSSLSGDDMQSYVGIGYDGSFGIDGRLGLSIDMGLTFESLSGALGASDSSDRAEQDAILGSRFESFRTSPSVSAGVEYRF